jgi:homocitrate synthase
VRFSTEDSMRTSRDDLFTVYEAVDAAGVDRVGIADTVGVATPREVFDLVSELRARVRADIEFHGHNDTGCAVANAFAALEAGATHLDATVLGVGERNGIAPLGGLVARLFTIDETLVAKYDLAVLRELDSLVAETLGVEIPFNTCITGSAAFSHKAGIHTNAVLRNPSTYEVLRPEVFGVTRQVHVAHRLTGWNAVRHRAEQLGLRLDEAQLRWTARIIKSRADVGPISVDDVDSLLADCAAGAQGGNRATDPC